MGCLLPASVHSLIHIPIYILPHQSIVFPLLATPPGAEAKCEVFLSLLFFLLLFLLKMNI